MATNDDMNRIYTRLLGESPDASPALRRALRDERGQREFIAKTIERMSRITDPLVLISMLVVGAAYLADEHSVSRDQLARVLLEARQSHAVELVTT